MADNFIVEHWIHAVFGALFVLISIFSGILPLKINTHKKKKLFGFLNTFKSGIGLSLGLFMILPRSQDMAVEFFKQYDDDYNHIVKDFGWTFLAAVLSFIFSIVVLKLIFDFKEPTHKHDHKKEIQIQLDKGDVPKKELEDLIKMKEEQEMKEEIKEDEEDEENFKNIVSSSGRFGTFLGMKKLSESLDENEHLVIKKGTSMVRASIVINKTFVNLKNDQINPNLIKSEQDKLFVNPTNVDKSIAEESMTRKEVLKQHYEEMTDDSLFEKNNLRITYVALSFMGFQSFFFGILVGSLKLFYDLLFISIGLAIYKSIELFLMGVTLKNAKINMINYIRMFIIQLIFIPLGIVLVIIIKLNILTQAILYGVASGILIYQTASESIIEEFTFTDSRYTKYFIYLFGSVVIASFEIITKIVN